MSKQTITTRISDEAKKILDATKALTGMSKEQIIEKSIRAHAPELARKMGA